MKRVLLVGLRGSSVDFSKWPGLSREKLESAFAMIEAELGKAGFLVEWCLTDDGATAEERLRAALSAFQPDIVSIGAGIRADPELLLLFETLVNVVHQQAPQARLAFNTDPLDTIASVRRAASST